MKDKLQLEEVLPYLLYDLKINTVDGLGILVRIDKKEKMVLLSNPKNKKSQEEFYIEDCSLLLRPLSGFQKKTGRELMDVFSIDLSTVHEIWNLIDKNITLDEISLKTYNAMCKNHFDFKNLIGRGLAIDIKTIK
tara:strand:+ start:2589 stop:2993 length:405 start_codon:yes stop_codon:yes gene_type:complete